MTDCSPPGQVLFTGLNLGDYSINVTHPDYQEYLSDSYVLGSPWQSQKIFDPKRPFKVNLCQIYAFD